LTKEETSTLLKGKPLKPMNMVVNFGWREGWQRYLNMLNLEISYPLLIRQKKLGGEQ